MLSGRGTSTKTGVGHLCKEEDIPRIPPQLQRQQKMGAEEIIKNLTIPEEDNNFNITIATSPQSKYFTIALYGILVTGYLFFL
jgi:hypothetical protein